MIHHFGIGFKKVWSLQARISSPPTVSLILNADKGMV